jgi:hypothetical protein
MEFDIVLLSRKGFVRTGATGQSITRINGVVENLLDIPLHLLIRPGTCFRARGNFQNMAVRYEYKMRLAPGEIVRLDMKAVCMQAEKPIPKGSDIFRGVHHVSAELAKFIGSTRFIDAITVQAGVWAITDRYSADQIKARLMLVDRLGGVRMAISDRDIAYARQLLDGLGIRHNL